MNMTSTQQIAIVLNPVADEEVAQRLVAAVEDRGLEVTWLETTPDDPGRGQAEAALAAGAELVIACGGDGTVRACVEALAGSDAALAVIPAGTGNLLARNLGIPDDTKEALEIALGSGRRTLDVGICNGERFAIMGGVGLDAAIMHDTGREMKQRFGVAAYVLTTLRHLRDERFPSHVRADGELVHLGPTTTVLVGNLGQIQAGLDIFPDSSPTDGALDGLVARPRTLREWLAAGWALIWGTETEPVQRFSGREVVIDLVRPTPYELDGEERPPTTALRFGVETTALRVCVHEEDQ